jgi:hypothetical protein
MPSGRGHLGCLASLAREFAGLVDRVVSRMRQPKGDLERWRHSLLGHTRRETVLLLGPPQAAAGSSDARLAYPATFWQAATWYYIVDKTRKLAIAVTFVTDRAALAQWITVPGGSVPAASVEVDDEVEAPARS